MAGPQSSHPKGCQVFCDACGFSWNGQPILRHRLAKIKPGGKNAGFLPRAGRNQ
jgi:hypothetical protein